LESKARRGSTALGEEMVRFVSLRLRLHWSFQHQMFAIAGVAVLSSFAVAVLQLSPRKAETHSNPEVNQHHEQKWDNVSLS